MSDRILTQKMLETFRADFWQWRHQRAKLEKIQKMRQAIERLRLAERHLKTEACEAD